MSNIQLIIEERAADIGNFMVGRLLPFYQKRSVGSFVFIDHMGPAQLSEYQNLDVPPHPHIGLSTLTYLFEGAIMHRDSLGTEMMIEPGAVNWMTAGKGVVHSERTPEHLRNSNKRLHGLQIWIALPAALEETDPSFTHIPAEMLPVWHEQHAHFKLIAGTFGAHKSPVPVHSDLYLLEITSTEATTLDIGAELWGETALYILKGAIRNDGERYESKHILIAKEAQLCSFEMEADTQIYIFGGTPFEEERFINWNFVSSRKDRLQQAKEDWMAQRFPKIEGETDYVPYPSLKK